MMVQGVLIEISGDIQRFKFKQFVLREGVCRNMTGWVRNVSDGAVQIFLTNCTPEKAKEMHQVAKSGPGQIEKIEISGHTDEPVGIGFHTAPTYVRESTSL